jgi:hypothetical protein
MVEGACPEWHGRLNEGRAVRVRTQRDKSISTRTTRERNAKVSHEVVRNWEELPSAVHARRRKRSAAELRLNLVVLGTAGRLEAECPSGWFAGSCERACRRRGSIVRGAGTRVPERRAAASCSTGGGCRTTSCRQARARGGTLPGR